MKKLRGYIFSRPFRGSRIPQHVQNIVNREYCVRNKAQFLLSATEYAMENSDFILNQTLNELVYIDGIVAYSLFQMPEDHNKRVTFLQTVISQGKEIHFAVENMVLAEQKDIDEMETMLQIEQTLSVCPQVILL